MKLENVVKHFTDKLSPIIEEWDLPVGIGKIIPAHELFPHGSTEDEHEQAVSVLADALRHNRFISYRDSDEPSPYYVEITHHGGVHVQLGSAETLRADWDNVAGDAIAEAHAMDRRRADRPLV